MQVRPIIDMGITAQRVAYHQPLLVERIAINIAHETLSILSYDWIFDY